MLRREQIAIVMDTQQDSFVKKDISLIRHSLKDVPIFSSFATIITGVRRCGKSTLLLQIIKDRYKTRCTLILRI
jgi:predicted AAA+ superfamily ATPase